MNLLLAGALAALASDRADDKIRVLTTTPDLRDIAAQVGGDLVEVTSLLRGPEDPHFIDAKPSYIKAANRADVFVKNGMSLEAGYETRIVAESRNPKIQPGGPGYVDASVAVEKLGVPTGVVDRTQGDVHPEGNPHFLLDPMNGRRVAATIRDALTRIAPEHRAALEQRCAGFQRSLDEAFAGPKALERFSAESLAALLSERKLAEFLKQRNADGDLGGWAARMLPSAGKPVVAFHPNVEYFAHRFGLEIVATLEPKPGVQPSSTHLERVIATMKTRGVRAVFFNGFQPRKPVDKACAETGAEPVLFPLQVDAAPEASSYLKLIDTIVRLSTSALAKP